MSEQKSEQQPRCPLHGPVGRGHKCERYHDDFVFQRPDIPVSQPSGEAPERILTVGGHEGHFYLNKGNFAKIEYVRAPSPDSIREKAERAALEIFPPAHVCLKKKGYEECDDCRNGDKRRQNIADIIAQEFSKSSGPSAQSGSSRSPTG
jgi:hypothetical protein